MSAYLTKTLGVVCPSCDFLNVIGAVRCMTCGSATDGSTPAAAAPAAPVKVEAPRAAPPPAREPEAPVSAPPGLAKKPAGVPVAGAVAPSGAHRAPEGVGAQPATPKPGQPARPTFQSSAAPPPAAVPGPRFGLTVLAGPARGQRFKLAATGAQIGRSRGVILFPEDPFVSALHATLIVRDGKLVVRDDASTSGVYVSISNQETIAVGATFATGLRLFRYLGAIVPAPPWNRRDVQVYGAPLPNNQEHYVLEEVLLGDRPARALMSAGPTITIGQGACDLSFPNDEGLAPRHCEVAPLPNGAMVRDLSAGLGTYVRVQGERVLRPGDRIRVGQQTLQVEELK